MERGTTGAGERQSKLKVNRVTWHIYWDACLSEKTLRVNILMESVSVEAGYENFDDHH